MHIYPLYACVYVYSHYRHLSSSHDSDDSSEDDTDWALYRQQVKSHNFDSSMEDRTPDIPSSPCSTTLLSDHSGVEPARSWSEMLQQSSPLQHLAPVTSFVVDTDITEVTSVSVMKSESSQENPSIVRKVGKKSKVRKHAKKKKLQAVGNKQKKEDTPKNKQKENKERSCDVKSAASGSPLVSSLNVAQANNPSDDGNDVSVSMAPSLSQAEDVDKIKMRLEAQINARMGFGAFPSESIIYDKVRIYCMHSCLVCVHV